MKKLIFIIITLLGQALFAQSESRTLVMEKVHPTFGDSFLAIINPESFAVSPVNFYDGQLTKHLMDAKTNKIYCKATYRNSRNLVNFPIISVEKVEVCVSQEGQILVKNYGDNKSEKDILKDAAELLMQIEPMSDGTIYEHSSPAGLSSATKYEEGGTIFSRIKGAQ
tara:strand:+ start:11299 stop:11799 length:501 start_codon:yes stop_codon:yes gene_type:complete